MSNDITWFATTPEAVLRAESILAAFREDRLHDIGGILAHDQDGTTDPVHLMVALVCMGDRLAEYAAMLHDRWEGRGTTAQDITREAARLVSQAVYDQRTQPGSTTESRTDEDGHP